MASQRRGHVRRDHSRMRAGGRFSLVAAALVVTLASPGSGDDKATAPIRVPGPPSDVVLPVHTVAHPTFVENEHMEYEFGWKGIPAAHASLEVEVIPWNEADVGGPESDKRVRVKGEAETLDWLDWIWKMHDSVDAVFDGTTLEPETFYFRQRERGDKIDTHLEFSWKDGEATSRRNKNGNEKEWVFPITRAYDPVSAAFLLRGVDLAVGDSKLVEVINGKTRYLVTMHVRAKERITVPAGTFEAFRLEPDIRNFNGPPVPPSKRKLREVSIWISVEPPRQILKIQSEVFWGHVYGELLQPKRRPRSAGDPSTLG